MIKHVAAALWAVSALCNAHLVSAAESTKSESSVAALEDVCEDRKEASESCAKTSEYGSSTGELVFRKHCAICHEGSVGGAPARYMLSLMSTAGIYHALTQGLMQSQGAQLEEKERRQVAEYLTGYPYVPKHYRAPLQCERDRDWFGDGKPAVGTGWGIDPWNTRVIPGPQARVTASSLKSMKLRWAFAYPGASRIAAQPLISNGTLFVGSQDGVVYALDTQTGCARWTFKAAAQIKGALIIRGATLWFGDTLAHAYALDARTGRAIWNVRVDDHPAATITGTPVWAGDRLYVPVASHEEGFASSPSYSCCSFRGSVVALDAGTGELLWKRYTIPTPPVEQYRNTVGIPQLGPSGAGVWSTLLVDSKRRALYFTTGNNYSFPGDQNSDAIFRIDLKSGEVQWRIQTLAEDTFNHFSILCHFDRGETQEDCSGPMKHGPDADFTAPPVLVRDALRGDILVAARKDGAVFGVDPDRGVVVWSNKPQVIKLTMAGVMAVGSTVLVPTLGVLRAQPGYPSSASSGGGLYALNAFTGKTLWVQTWAATCPDGGDCPGASSAPIGTRRVAFVGASDGYLRAYEVRTGRMLFELPTAREYTTLNGDVVSGGSISLGSIMIADGSLYVNSGSVLLALSSSR